MPPQQREMHRVTSESDMSEAGEPSSNREYRVRKSSLIGYVCDRAKPFRVWLVDG